MKLKYWHTLALISCSVWLAYYPALSAPLNSVDDARLAHDLLNRSGFSWKDFWIPNSTSYFRPLVNSSFIIDQLLWGFEAPLLHFENVLIHWLNTMLVYRLSLEVARRLELQAAAIPFMAAMLFGLHPINTEAVIWVAGRADLLATTFVLLAILCAMKAFSGKVYPWTVAAALAFFAGTLAKETALFLLPGLFVMGCLSRRDRLAPNGACSPIKDFLPALACTFSAALYMILRMSALKGKDAGMRQVNQIFSGSSVGMPTAKAEPELSNVLAQLETLIRGAGFYARKLVQPFPLNFGIVEVSGGYFLGGCLLILLLGLLFWQISWEGSFVLTAMCLASAALLVALGNSSWTPFAERYMYGPSAMLAVGGSLAAGRAFRRFDYDVLRSSVTWGSALLLLVCFVGIFQRGMIWQNNLTLFADTVKKSPTFALAQNQLAGALLNRGRNAEALEIVRNLDVPDTQVAFINKVMIFREEGRLEEARMFLLENLNKSSTQGYHTTILERLIEVVEQMRARSRSPEQGEAYDDEVIGYMNELWRRTHKPFYLYRLGQKQMARGDVAAAQESFALAYVKLPEDSIYKMPARKLAESLKGL